MKRFTYFQDNTKIYSNSVLKNIIGSLILQNSVPQSSTGCCPNENLFERSLKRFLFINLGEVKEMRFQLFEPEG